MWTDITLKYVQGVTQDYCTKFPRPIPSEEVYHSSGRSEMWQFTVPSVLVWDPIKQYEAHGIALSCPEHGNDLQSGPWRHTKDRTPRLLYDVNGPIILVMRDYVCQGGKRCSYTSGEALMTDQLPEFIRVPFMCSHRAGYTSLLASTILERMRQGIHFHAIQREFQQTVLTKYYRQQYDYCLSTPMSAVPHCHEDIFPHFEQYVKQFPIPSERYIVDVFQKTCSNEEIFLKEHMCSIDSGDWVSMDHTFKVSTNIGFIGPCGKWVQMYDSLFLIMNHIGQVMCFKFVKSVAFNEVEDLLRNIEDKCARLKCVYLDNCCAWKVKIQSVMHEVDVKLDLFHAIQRITKTLVKNDPMTKECTYDLKKCFRVQGDYGEDRNKDTPDIEALTLNVETFKKKWENCVSTDVTGTMYLSDETKKAIDNLLIHIKRGCLSGIPPSGGTNRNERFHQVLNSSALSVGRLSPGLADNILHQIVYQWNKQKQYGCQQGVPPPEIAGFDQSEHNAVCAFQMRKQVLTSINVQSVGTSEKEEAIPDSGPSLEGRALNEHEKNAYMHSLNFGQAYRQLSRVVNIGSEDECIWKLDNPLLHMTSILENTKSSINSKLTHDTRYRFPFEAMCTLALQEGLVEEEELQHIIIDTPIANMSGKYKCLSFVDSESVIHCLCSTCSFHVMTIFANVCNISLLLKNSKNTCSHLIVPCEKLMATTSPIFEFDFGYEPAIVSKVDVTRIYTSAKDEGKVSSDSAISCRCGVTTKETDGKNFCEKSRCTCHKNNKCCTSLCKCLHCANPYGVKSCVSMPTTVVNTRQRRKSHVNFNYRRTSDDLDHNDELRFKGKWMPEERALLHQVMRLQKKCARVSLTEQYNRIVQLKGLQCKVLQRRSQRSLLMKKIWLEKKMHFWDENASN